MDSSKELDAHTLYNYNNSMNRIGRRSVRPGSAFMWWLLVVGMIVLSTPSGATSITRVPNQIGSDFRINTTFYKKYVSVKGIPIIAPAGVSNRALLKAGHLMNRMLAPRRLGVKLASYIKKYRGRVSIVPFGEDFSYMPELGGNHTYDSAAGLYVGSTAVFNASSGKWKYFYETAFTREENALELGSPSDQFAPGASITIHEFAHSIQDAALYHELPGIYRLIQKAYKKAIKAGKYQGAYAATNYSEYWAEGTEVWFASDFNDVFGIR